MSSRRERSSERSTRSRSSRASSSANSDSCPADSAAPAASASDSTPANAPAARRRARAEASMSEDEDEDDEDWNEDDEDEEAEDAEGGEGNEIGGRQAAQLFSAILREMGGNGRSSRVSSESRAIIHRLMHGAGRFIQQDEDGNLVLSIPDGMELDLDEEEDAEDGEEEGEDEDEEGEDEESSQMEDEDDASRPPLEPVPIQLDREALDEYAQYTHQTSQNRPAKNLLKNLVQFQQSPTRITQPTLSNISANYIPSVCTSVEQFEGRAFCGKFSSGSSSSSSSSSSAGLPSMFASATQDGLVHLYETNSWKLFKEIEARDIGWSIVDIDFSLDSRFVIYSSWSSCVHLINTSGEYELHEALDFEAGSPSQFHSHVCMFGIKFSSNESREILAGLNGGVAMLYDIERKRQIWSARAHEEDINSVAWLDNSGDLFATASDDSSIRIWDRRILSNPSENGGADSEDGDFKSSQMVGGFLGHTYGVTCVSAMGDGNARYVLSNSKDQSMKLWDLRRMNSASDVERLCNDRSSMTRRSVDYRWERVSRRDAAASATTSHKTLDHSLVTFTGHSVARTLVRCGFSPQHSTGFKYVFSGSADGKIFVYDVLTGEVVKTIAGHDDVVRDVSWQDSLLVSSSWDCTVRRHALHEENLVDNKEKISQAQSRRGGRAAQTRRRYAGLGGF